MVMHFSCLKIGAETVDFSACFSRMGDGERLFLIEAPDGTYQLTLYDPDFEQKMNKAEDIISRYRNTLRALAKWNELVWINERDAFALQVAY